MYAAGRRTVRPPVRFQDYATERIAQHLAPIQSTPTDVTERQDNVLPTAERRPTTDRKTQLSWMQQELINVTHDLEQFQLELDHLENQQQGATGISPIRDHPPTDSGSVRARSSASGVTGQQTQFTERENGASRPSLQDIRAMNRLAGHDPLQQFDLRGPLPRSGRPDVKKPVVTTLTDFSDFPVVSAPLPQGSALSSQERPVRAQPQQDLRGKTKIVSGSQRKVHDLVVKQIAWPHEFVFHSSQPVTPDNLTWDQLMAGELAIIYDDATPPRESSNRAIILQNLLLDVSTYTFPGIRAFYKTWLLHAERGMFDLEAVDIMPALGRLKQQYLRQPQVEVQSFSSHSFKPSKFTGGSNTCELFQNSACSHPSDHKNASGTMLMHQCKYCTVHRPEVPLRHPAAKCIYKDKAKREEYNKAPQCSSHILNATHLDNDERDKLQNRPSTSTLYTASASSSQRRSSFPMARPVSSVPSDISGSSLPATASPSQRSTNFPMASPVSNVPSDISGSSLPATASPSQRSTSFPMDSLVNSSVPAQLSTEAHTGSSEIRHSHIDLHQLVKASGLYNFQGLRVPVPSNLHISAWRNGLQDYSDAVVADFLEFGWPINYSSDVPPRPVTKNHSSATHFAEHVDNYISKELSFNSISGPFRDNPLASPLMVSPLQTVPKKDSAQRRVIMDLSFPPSSSVNSGIPGDDYLGLPYHLRLPRHEAFEELIRSKGHGCLLFKRDLSRAYRQLPVDPHDYNLLGFKWRDEFYFDTVFPFGLRSAALACQRTTNAVTHIYRAQGFSAVNYIDDFGGAEHPAHADEAFRVLAETFVTLGLQESPEKASPPSTVMTFLGIGYDSLRMVKFITEDRLEDMAAELQQWPDRKRATKRQVQSLLGKLIFLTACVPQGRVFLSRIINILKHLKRASHRIRLNNAFRQDVLWWQRFLPAFNGSALIPMLPPTEVGSLVATDACLSGCGGVCPPRREYFHREFPPAVLAESHAIHRLETLAIVVACKLWAQSWAGQRLFIGCDNMASTQVINSGRHADANWSSFRQNGTFIWQPDTFQGLRPACRISLAELTSTRLTQRRFKFSWFKEDGPLARFPISSSASLTIASDWSVLEADTLQTQRQAFALSTQANHRSSFRSYLGFCEFFRKTPIPASPHQLSCYVQFLSRSVKSVATISHHLSAVKLLHQFHGFYDLDLSGFELQQTLRGLKKTLRHQPREHHPVTPEFLLRVHPLINHSDPTDATIWAVILVGFFTFLRRSNLAPASVKSFDPNKNLCRRDISVAPEGLLIRVRWTKTIQANERRLEIPVLAIPNSPLCPVRAYVNMVRLIPAVPSSPAFQLPASSNPARPLTISALDKAFARLVVAAGLPSRFHTLHDLRRGGYTFAFEAGVPRELRRQHGDWRSDADLLYLHLPLAERLKLPAAMRGLLLQRLASHDTTLTPTYNYGVIGLKGLITENCDIVLRHDSDVTSVRSEERTQATTTRPRSRSFTMPS
ncbi:cytoplasmic pattern recognition receptor signaling pathway in response to virus [Branchiostoma belcheri]|nr:cytoplasmic pattern recognition receptor signaling pathway in response to virus [Branchiostoma belcheri]